MAKSNNKLISRTLVRAPNPTLAIGQLGGHVKRGITHPRGKRTGKSMALISALPLAPGSDRMVLTFLDRSDPAESFDYLPHKGDNADWGYDPTTVLICKFEDGTVGKTASTLDCKMPYAFNVDVLGTEGTIRDNRLWSESTLPGQSGWATIPTVLPDSGDVAHHPFNGQIEALVAGILDGAKVLPDLDDAMKTHELVFAADKSAETGIPIKLPL